jgi:hypothetical protein
MLIQALLELAIIDGCARSSWLKSCLWYGVTRRACPDDSNFASKIYSLCSVILVVIVVNTTKNCYKTEGVTYFSDKLAIGCDLRPDRCGYSGDRFDMIQDPPPHILGKYYAETRYQHHRQTADQQITKIHKSRRRNPNN